MKKIIKIILGVLIGLIVLGTGYGAYYFYSKYQDLKKNPTAAVQEETKVLIEKIGQLIQLPSDEDPTLATVQDKEKLKDQVFFVNAENGDKVLIYMKNKKAFLYRPSTDKIIEVAPLVMENNSSSGVSASATATVKN